LKQAEAKKRTLTMRIEAARAGYREVNEIKSYLVTLVRRHSKERFTARNVNVGAYVGPILEKAQSFRCDYPSAAGETSFGNFDSRKCIAAISSKVNDVHSKFDQCLRKTSKQSSARLSGALDLRLRSQRAEADIDNTDGKLLAGTVADVITTLRSSANSFIVPKSAVVNSADQAVFCDSGLSDARRVTVKKGLEANDLIRNMFGTLSENDTLLKKAATES